MLSIQLHRVEGREPDDPILMEEELCASVDGRGMFAIMTMSACLRQAFRKLAVKIASAIV
jgi:hypothetical protein